MSGNTGIEQLLSDYREALLRKMKKDYHMGPNTGKKRETDLI